MKRTTLMVDEQLLKNALLVLGAKTYSEAVDTALKETLRWSQIRGITDFFGSGKWSGDLDEMRKSRSFQKKRTGKKK